MEPKNLLSIIVYQDNQSSILLEKNGRASSSKRIRHINIRYFFVTDRIAAKEIAVEYCPTGDMLADFFTKPLQGALFKKFRDQIMNVDSATDSWQDRRSVLRSVNETVPVIAPYSNVGNGSGADSDADAEWTVVKKRVKREK
jgi:hypothetical protein